MKFIIILALFGLYSLITLTACDLVTRVNETNFKLFVWVFTLSLTPLAKEFTTQILSTKKEHIKSYFKKLSKKFKQKRKIKLSTKIFIFSVIFFLLITLIFFAKKETSIEIKNQEYIPVNYLFLISHKDKMDKKSDT